MTFSFAKEIYSKEALIRAAYSFTDRFYLHLDCDEESYYVSLKPKNPSYTVQMETFQNELLAQMVRIQIREQTKTVRELLLARAFSSTIIVDAPEQVASSDETDISEILKDWFEKYE